MMGSVLVPPAPPALSRPAASALLSILLSARDGAEPLEGPGTDESPSPKEGITHERTAA